MAVDPSPALTALPANEDRDASNLHEYIGTLLVSRGLIAGIVVVSLFAGLLYARLATPIYRSDALVQVEDKKKGTQGLEDIVGTFSTDSVAETEIEILRSRSLVSGVVHNLSLNVTAEPRYFPIIGRAVARAYRGPGVRDAPIGLSRWAWGGERILVNRLDVAAELESEALVLVAGERGAYTVFDSDGKELVRAEVGKPSRVETGPVSMFVSELRARPGTQFYVMRRPEQDVVEGLQKELVIAEKGKKTGVIRIELSGPNIPRVVATLDALSTAYLRQNVERKSEEAEKTLEFINSQLPEVKARLEQAEEALNTYRSTHKTLDVTLEMSATLDRAVDLERSAAEFQLQRAEFSQRFTDQHPVMMAVKKKLAEVESERAALDKRIKNLPESELNSVRLLRDVKVTNELYVLLLNKVQELRVAKSGTIGNVRILDRALTPRKQVHPRLGQSLVLGLMLGLLLGVLAAFARRALNRGVDDPEVLEAITGLNVYASVPHSDSQAQYARTQKRGMSPESVLAKRDPSDLAIESLRSLRTSLQFALVDARNKVIAFSGPSPGIGKTFVSSNLSQVLADSGKRVLLVDTDLRNGSVHRNFGLSRGPGLSDVIVGSTSFDEAVHRVSEHLHVLTAGMIPPNPSELLMSQRLRDLIDRSGKQYDLVVMDTCPILAVTDAAIIAALAGVTLLVLRAGEHPIREVTLALKRFSHSGVKPAGLVFNDVPRSVANGYGYGYHYQYDYRKSKVS